MIRIGTAGWAIPRAVADRFPAEGTGLQRYAGRFDCVEINSTFYRPHKPETFRRWTETTPEGFRFAVKAPKTITHDARLADPEERLDRFLGEVSELGAKLGPVLVQLPPSLQFDADVAGAFFDALRDRFDGPVACEPRHATWFEAAADALLADRRIARVAADPARVPAAADPGGWRDLVYIRLHGSPHMYRSAYEPDFLERIADQVSGATDEAWCVFDNTTLGAAANDALTLADVLRNRRG